MILSIDLDARIQVTVQFIWTEETSDTTRRLFYGVSKRFNFTDLHRMVYDMLVMLWFVLIQTPVRVAIDANYNEITFFLQL